jgi:hypothetical protein
MFQPTIHLWMTSGDDVTEKAVGHFAGDYCWASIAMGIFHDK